MKELDAALPQGPPESGPGLHLGGRSRFGTKRVRSRDGGRRVRESRSPGARIGRAGLWRDASKLDGHKTLDFSCLPPRSILGFDSHASNGGLHVPQTFGRSQSPLLYTACEHVASFRFTSEITAKRSLQADCMQSGTYASAADRMICHDGMDDGQ